MLIKKTMKLLSKNKQKNITTWSETYYTKRLNAK